MATTGPIGVRITDMPEFLEWLAKMSAQGAYEALMVAAGWGEFCTAEECASVAREIEALAANGDAGCCPLCQEITCDETCPLRHLRGLQ
jgi:hypothetical protein